MKVEVKPDLNVNNEIISTQTNNERVVPKVETQICKDENENIVTGVNLNNNKTIDLTPKRIRFRRYTFDDFNLLKVLGRGSFGKVFSILILFDIMSYL